MFDYYFHEEGYGVEYIELRKKLDSLCRKIAGGEIASEKALTMYDEIEKEYTRSDNSRGDLFSMIYKSRIVRLCNQYSLESA